MFKERETPVQAPHLCESQWEQHHDVACFTVSESEKGFVITGHN